MSTFLITGGSGFIGSHLVDALIARGNQVTVIDWVEPSPERKNNQATYITKDIRDASIESVFATYHPEVVFHLAAHIDDRASVQDPAMNAEHNIGGSINVLRNAQRFGAKKVVFASSCAVYGVQENMPVHEYALPHPRTPYGISKLAGEMYLDFYQKTHGIATVALRFANVYGPRQDGSKESGAIAIFIDKLLKNEQPYINADGNTMRDYIFIDDIIAALVSVSEQDISGVYNVGTGKETSTNTVLELVQKHTKSPVQGIPRPEVRDAVQRMVLDTTSLQKACGWKAEISVEEGIQKTVAWYRGHI